MTEDERPKGEAVSADVLDRRARYYGSQAPSKQMAAGRVFNGLPAQSREGLLS